MKTTRLLQDYYAALSLLYHDFAAGDTENLQYFHTLATAFNALVLEDQDVDKLDMAWEEYEKGGDCAAFDQVVAAWVKRAI